MKRVFFVASALLMAGVAVAQNQETNKPYVEISSMADTLVVPNKFRISITLSEATDKGKTPIAQLEKSLATALKASGVDMKEQLVITGQSNADGKRKDIYQFKSYLLTLTDPAQVETVFSELKTNGISNASLTESTRSDLRELQALVRVKAMKNAQTTASELAGALGQKIGSAIMIQSYSAASADNVMVRGMMAAKSGNAVKEASMPDLQFNDVRVSQNVTVRFALE